MKIDTSVQTIIPIRRTIHQLNHGFQFIVHGNRIQTDANEEQISGQINGQSNSDVDGNH